MTSGGDALGDTLDPIVVNAQLQDGSGNPIESLNGAINVHVADVHDTLINRNAANFTGTTSTLNGAVSAGAVQITVNDAATFVATDWLQLTDGTTQETNFVQVVDATADPVLEIDRPLDNSYSNGAGVEKVLVNLASTVGSRAAPISYIIQPPTDETWHILRMLISITDDTNTAMTYAVFGNIAALTNGVVVRRDNNGTHMTLTNWKKNADFIEDAYDWDPNITSPANEYGMKVRWTLEKAGSYVKLIGSTNDHIEILIQDDLTALDDFQIKLQGHKEG
jgi:hypothetical protein